jgi:multidrug efflux pump
MSAPDSSTFDRFNLSRWALEHRPLVTFFIVLLLFSGLFAYTKLGQNEDPPFTFRAMAIRVIWPGATATQIAEQVVDRIERKLSETPNFLRVRTYVKPGEAQFIVELKQSSPPKTVPDSWYQLRKKIGDIRGQLPTGVIGPFFNDEFGDVFGTLYALNGAGFTPAEIKRAADSLRLELLRVADVGKVEILGAQDEKVFLEVSHQKLASLGLNVLQIVDAISTQNGIDAAGVLTTREENIQVRVPGVFKKIGDLENLLLRVVAPTTGQVVVVRVGDIANVTRGYVEPMVSKIRLDGKDTLVLGVAMAPGGDIVALGKQLTAERERLQQALPLGMQLRQVQDQPQAVKESVGDFLSSLIEAIVVVLAVSFLSLGLHRRSDTTRMPWLKFRLDVRPGMVVLLTIPLVLAVTFFFMWMFDIGLHKISLGALIISLGLLVDDAIIAVEMMVRKMEEGMGRLEAAAFAYRATAFPMLTGTLITVAGFVPVGFAKSAAGEYTYSIYAVTGLALIVSWFAAVLAVPLFGYKLLRASGPEQAHHELFNTPFYNRFRALVTWCVAHRWITIGVTLLSFVGGLGLMTIVEKQFFPDSPRREMLIDLWGPEGTSTAASERNAIEVENWINARDAQRKKEGKAPAFSSMTSFIGFGAPRFFLTLDQVLPQTNVAQLVVVTNSVQERDELRRDLLAAAKPQFGHMRLRVRLLPNGPPVTYPVQFRITGSDPQKVRAIAEQVKEKMRANPNTVGVNDNWNEPVKSLRLEVDQEKARALGVPAQTIARAAQTLLSGSTIGTFREDDKSIDIVLRQPVSERNTLDALGQASLPTASGKYVPLAQLATARLEWEPGVMWRQNAEWMVIAQSDIVDGIQAPTVSGQIDATLAQIRASLPIGYRLAVAGATEESAVANDSIAANLPVMVALVFILLMVQLQSFSRALIVFITAPLGIFGAAMTLFLLKAPMGFVALLGIIALFGMIMRNSVILIDQIEQDRSAGVPAWEAVIEASVRRYRPIMLTAAAAILAMIPLTRNTLWGPMAVAVMGGLVVATALTLLFLPALYAAWFRVSPTGAPAPAAVPPPQPQKAPSLQT